MPTGQTGRKQISELVKGVGKFEQDIGVDYNYATVEVTGSADVDPIGTPLVWTGSAFEPLAAQDLALVSGDSNLPNGALYAVTVGAKEGIGFNKQDVTLSATPTQMTVMFRGTGAIAAEGITWGAATAGNQTIFKQKLEKAGIAVVESAESVTPTFVG